MLRRGLWLGDFERGTSVVYSLVDSDRRPLYIGVTNYFRGRMKQHMRQPYWEDVVAVRCEAFPSRAEAEAYDGAAIRNALPKHNVAMGSGLRR